LFKKIKRMKRIPSFKIFEAGGELAGNINFMDVTFDDALNYLKLHGKTVKHLSNFKENFEDAQYKVSDAWKERNEMPVVSQKQMKKLQKYMDDNKLTFDGKSISFNIRKTKASLLKPVQREIYLDKSLDRIIVDDLQNVFDNLKNAKFIATKDEYLVDGHHKWLTAMFLDPSMFISVLFIDLPLNDLLNILEEFENLVGNVKNN